MWRTNLRLLAIAFVSIAFFGWACRGQESKPRLKLIDDGILGAKIDQPLTIFKDNPDSTVDPSFLQMDYDKGIISAASVFYPAETRFVDAINCLNKYYKEWEVDQKRNRDKMRLWRNEKNHFSIQLIRGDESRLIELRYIRFRDESGTVIP